MYMFNPLVYTVLKAGQPGALYFLCGFVDLMIFKLLGYIWVAGSSFYIALPPIASIYAIHMYMYFHVRTMYVPGILIHVHVQVYTNAHCLK